MVILGIDPGTATTGYGVIRHRNSDVEFRIDLIDYGCIVTPKDKEMPLRLYSIQKDIKRLLKQHKPDCVIVEQLFFGANSRTAMSVGQARGVVLSAAAGYRIPVFEYQGLHVKSILTGSGRADKKQIQKSVMKYLGKRKLKKPINGYLDDAADALAVAICHVLKSQNAKRLTTNAESDSANAKKLH
ncbi:crossover junction endodeoxyribonuclease RuvC [Candidatus Curtissbacteria bacterium]|nr:crossover junction endodeoxyribonuclease RuvC [Candidatus Curtissbacteria bacterium]